MQKNYPIQKNPIVQNHLFKFTNEWKSYKNINNYIYMKLYGFYYPKVKKNILQQNLQKILQQKVAKNYVEKKYNIIISVKNTLISIKPCFLLDGIEYSHCFLLDGFPIRNSTQKK